MRLALITVFTGCALWAGSAAAQVTSDQYAPPPPPAPGTPESQPGAIQPADVAPPAPAQAQGQALVQGEERFDVDCDPDIDVCVDPQADNGYDDGYDPNAYQQFQSTLSPYGTWTDDPNYGQVWVPSPDVVGADFEPYASAGQWVASNDYGFAWASDYDWGWAPFHYGRWIILGGYGWSWVPGSLWGPAWVDWRYGNGYCGWAPLPPRGVVGPPPRGGSGGAYGNNGHNRWHFTVASQLMSHNPRGVPASVVATVFPRTQPVNNARVVSFAGGVSGRINMGPAVDRLSRDIGRPVATVSLSHASPSTLPRTSVVPRAGVQLDARPYVRNVSAAPVGGYGSATRSGYIGTAPPTGARNLVHPNGYAEPPRAYPQQSTYPQQQPAQPYAVPHAYGTPAYPPPAATYRPVAPSQPYQPYQQPAQMARPYNPGYSQPARTYQQPAYQAPTQHYSSPAYSAPAQRYSAPAPAYSSPARSAPSAPVMTRPSSPSFSAPTQRRR